MSEKNKGTWQLEPNEKTIDPELLKKMNKEQWAALLESAAFKEAVKEIAIQAVAEQLATRSGPVGRAL